MSDQNHLNIVQVRQSVLLSNSYDWREFERLLSVSIEVLYEVSTCAHGCRGGDHRIEYITGRSYNLAVGAVSLINLGLYDEALCLVRQLGEITNLLALFAAVPSRYTEWVTAKRGQRLKNFSPQAVRNALGQLKDLGIPIDEHWYRMLCEEAVHVTPDTLPNAHNDEKRPMVGGRHDNEARQITVSHLANVANWVAILAAGLTGQNELLERAAAADPQLSSHTDSS
jgi:hypothetical protein